MKKGSCKIIKDKNSIINAIECSNKITELMKNLNSMIPTIKRSCAYHNIPYPNYRKVAKCNENFFGIINEQSMYWAGFLAADGNLRKQSSYSIKLELATKDRKHIEYFKKCVQSEAIIHDTKRKPSKLVIEGNKHKKSEKYYYNSWIVINSKKMFDDLEKFNIVPQKTYKYEMPQWLINHSLVHHFIRGYIDGDGCFTYNKRNNKKVGLTLSLTGASNVVEQIYNIICAKSNTNFGGYKKQNEKRKYFWFHSLIDLDKIIKFLYSTATIYLERKYELTKLLPELIEQSSIYNFDPVELQNLYNNLGSFRKVGKIFNCSGGTIRYQMKKLHLKYKISPQMSRKK